jgi:hypothetical protein
MAACGSGHSGADAAGEDMSSGGDDDPDIDEDARQADA